MLCPRDRALVVDTGHLQPKADTEAFPGTLLPDPNGPILPCPQLHIISNIATTAGFTLYFHTCDLARHHP